MSDEEKYITFDYVYLIYGDKWTRTKKDAELLLIELIANKKNIHLDNSMCNLDKCTHLYKSASGLCSDMYMFLCFYDEEVPIPKELFGTGKWVIPRGYQDKIEKIKPKYFVSFLK